MQDAVRAIARETDVDKRLVLFRRRIVPRLREITEMSDAKLREYIDENKRLYGIVPGTQIFYTGAFGIETLQHHGVFIGSGVVSEVGGKWCKLSKSGGSFLEQCLSVNTLEDFVIRGNGTIHRVVYSHIDMADVGTVRTQMKRALQMTTRQEWSYNPFKNNCQHWSSFVVTGDAEITQFCRRLQFTTHKVRIPKSQACETQQCHVYSIAPDGSACEHAESPGWAGRYCYTDRDSNEWSYIDKSQPRRYACKRAGSDSSSPAQSRNKRRKLHACISGFGTD